MGKWKSFLLLAVFLLFVFLRFYNIDKRIIFDWDQQNFSYQIKNIVEKGKFTLIGPRANNDLGFFLGPYFTYLLLPFYLATGLDPSALIYFIILVDFLFFWISFYFLKKILNFYWALVFLLLWSINHLLAFYDIIPWWPILIPMGTILVLNFLFEISKKNLKKDWFILGLVLGFFVNMHFQFIFIILYSVVFLTILFLKKLNNQRQKIFLLFIGFAIMFIPLFFFDLRHNFLNLRLFFNFFTGSQKQIGKDYFSWIIVLGNLLKPILGVNQSIWPVIFMIFLAFTSLILGKSLKNKFLRIFNSSLFVVLILIPLFFTFYGTRPSEYYFVFLYPLIYILFIASLSIIKKMRMIVLLIVFLLMAVFNVKPLINNLKDNDFGFFYKKKLIEKINEKTKEKKFNIAFQVPLGWNNGYDYLFDIYGIKQSKDYSDPSIAIRIPPQKKDIIINKIGLDVPESLNEKN